MAESALSIRRLTHTFNRGTPYETAGLRDVDLSLGTGDFVVVVGSNGSGKSTLLNAIAGSISVQSGQIEVGGIDVTTWPAHRRARLIARVFQDPYAGTAADMTVLENLAIASTRGLPRGLRRALVKSRREALAESVRRLGLGLEDRLDTPIGVLSGGQRQALTLLMAMLVRPSLLLLDEHTASLDPRSAELLLRLTQSFVAAERLTTIMVTHSMAQAVRLGNRTLIMHRGEVAYDLSGVQKRRARVEDLLSRFEDLRRSDMLDDQAADLLRRTYI
jgi:putative ABC transport system ATP-binding protein